MSIHYLSLLTMTITLVAPLFLAPGAQAATVTQLRAQLEEQALRITHLKIRAASPAHQDAIARLEWQDAYLRGKMAVLEALCKSAHYRETPECQ